LLRNLTTKVVAIRPADLAAPPPPKGKAKQKRVNTTAPSSANASGTATPVEGSASGDAAPKGKLYEIETLDTVIFPEGGGQPFDTGKLSIFNPNGEKDASLGSFVVEGCLRKKLEFIHLVRVPEEQQGLIEGLEGKEVVLDVDWERRIDQVSDCILCDVSLKVVV
jgi:alanyl-tRNA synthetase/misacylated tRNA(Ala) deacylase